VHVYCYRPSPCATSDCETLTYSIVLNSKASIGLNSKARCRFWAIVICIRVQASYCDFLHRVQSHPGVILSLSSPMLSYHGRCYAMRKYMPLRFDCVMSCTALLNAQARVCKRWSMAASYCKTVLLSHSALVFGTCNTHTRSLLKGSRCQVGAAA
jgi:hypothetical protein